MFFSSSWKIDGGTHIFLTHESGEIFSVKVVVQVWFCEVAGENGSATDFLKLLQNNLPHK